MLRKSLASRLATIYTALLAVTIFFVIAASSIALIYQLAGFSDDIIIAKHQEARILAARYLSQGLPLAQSAPRIADELTGIGLRVAVYDSSGRFLAGDRTVHPHILDAAVHGRVQLLPPPGALARGAPMPTPGPGHHPPHEWWAITAVDGGFVTFRPSDWIIFTNLIPYWRIIILVALVAVLISWFIGRLFAREALAPLAEVTVSLRRLADGDYTQRQFMAASGDEIALLTQAYNDATSGVASAMLERRQTEERMRQFIADAGHELRTPLTVIAGYIDVLRRGAIEEPKVAKQILATMALEKEHMRGLIDRLMRLARLDEETAPHRESIDAADLLRTQAEAARRLDEQCAIDYSLEEPISLVADRAELAEALWNVIENAIKYAPGTPVHLHAKRDNDMVVLSVRDEGPGMSEPERLHAFERFYRGDVRGEIPGTGLGLAIAKRAVERAGGRIEIESAPGRGTTVSIRLPRSD